MHSSAYSTLGQGLQVTNNAPLTGRQISCSDIRATRANSRSGFIRGKVLCIRQTCQAATDELSGSKTHSCQSVYLSACSLTKPKNVALPVSFLNARVPYFVVQHRLGTTRKLIGLNSISRMDVLQLTELEVA